MISLIDKRLIFVSGKGGVGKTTVAAALGVALAADGARVACIELGSDHVSERLGSPPAGYAGAVVSPGLEAFNITPRKAFAEYATRELRSHRLYALLLNNRFVHYFLDATPGINALLCLGKIWQMLQHGAWDYCVVDLPATGHGLGFLDVPRIVTTAIHLGPLRKLGEGLCATLQDAATTGVVLVTHLEELPVNEACEMAARLRHPLGIAWGPVIVNAVMADPVAPGWAAAWRAQRAEVDADPVWRPAVAATNFLHRRWTAERAEQARLAARLGNADDRSEHGEREGGARPALPGGGATRAPAIEMMEIPRYRGLTEEALIRTVADQLRPLVS